MRTSPVSVAELRALRLAAVGNPEDASAQAASALGAAQSSGDALCAAWARVVLGQAAVVRSRAGGALVILSQAASAFHTLGDEEGMLAAFTLLVNAWIMAGDLPSGRLTAGRALRLARRTGDRATEAKVLLNLAYAHGTEGDAVAYEMLTEQALVTFQGMNDERAVAHCLVNLADARMRTGQHSLARQCHERASRLCRANDWPYIEALLWCGRSALALALGDDDAARALHVEGIRRLEDVGKPYQRIGQNVQLYSTLAKRHPDDATRDALEDAASEADLQGYNGLAAQARSALAELFDVRGEVEAAQQARTRAELSRLAAKRKVDARRADEAWAMARASDLLSNVPTVT